MSLEELEARYLERISDFKAIASQLKKKFRSYSYVRLFSFFGGIALLILLWQLYWWLGLIATLFFLYLFYRFILWHQAIKKRQEHYEALVGVNENEIAALNHDFQVFKDGEQFKDPQHPYAVDLDIFGPYSFYQFSNRTTTVIGGNRLAQFFLQQADLDLIKQRQAALQELSPMLDWRQHFIAHGKNTKDSLEQIALLERWIEQDSFIIDNKRLRLLLWILPFLTAFGFLYCLYLQSLLLSALCLVPALLLLRRYVLRVNQVHQQTTHAEKALGQYAELIKHIEQEDFKSPLLAQFHHNFEGRASKAIQQLSYIISQLNARYNAFAILFNLFGLWDLQWVLRLEKWKRAQRAFLSKWFDALAEFEALSSLATVAYNNPDWTYPEFYEKELLQAHQLGHPLIHASKRIANEVTLPTKGHIKLLTGSNMAGKSTFLRTVGLNIVLASTGMPVCAQKMELPLLQVYTSMRTQDALHESTSSFYAELKRLKIIIDAVEEKDHIFFLLDEILKGTNSRDRHTGSKALIKQLIAQGGGGIIATHDLELGSLEAQYNGAIENWCMEVKIKEGQLFFDYLLQKGVSKSFNATHLMQQMGIRI